MSNYHYKDQRTSNCLENGSYSTLAETTNYSCDIPCLCRFSDERSEMDKMYYDWFVLGKQPVMPAVGQNLVVPKNNCNQKNIVRK